MRISVRVWILTICLALGVITILNGSAYSRMLAGFMVILIPLVFTYVNSNVGKVFIVAVLALCLVFVIYSSGVDGVVIKSIEKNSSGYEEGLRTGMVITSINGEKITNLEDYTQVIGGIFPTEKEKKVSITAGKEEIVFLTNETLKITVEEISRTNLKTGLDLSGGARALVSPERKLTSNEMSDLISVTSNRLNVFGLSDITVRQVSDLQGDSYLLVEVAGASPSDLKELISKQGKFEARIGNGSSAENITLNLVYNESEEINGTNSTTNITTNKNQTVQLDATGGILVFEGGEGDIADVCRNKAECSGITGCFEAEGGWACNFRFTIYLTPAAAEKHAAVTKNISLDSTGKYLVDRLYLYIDDQEVDSLYIGADLRGQVTTQVSIQGSGSGKTREDAFNDAKANMNKLQTVLITGSLPYKLNLVKLDTISPTLGREFAKNIIYLGLVVFGIICVLIFVKYRKIKITLAVILTIVSEAVLTLAVAALIRWNLDAPSIAGIIAGMGTGVNDQIIIIDESVSKENTGLKERIKRALFIIFGAFFTIVAAMLPLFWAGTGLLRGFALTTIIGVSVGILITRPAFADILRRISE